VKQDPDATRAPGQTGQTGQGGANESTETGGTRRIGPWRTLGILGEGGMGVVYLAERSDGAFDRQVALKLLRPGLDADSFEARFLQERRTLGALEHPYIARLLDAGRSEDGLPYFAMERVEGQPIDAWCQSHGLDIEARIGLFLQVCEAVQYAHGRLIVHRDIKPSNVLVDTEGRVRLLDFGIAKLLDETGEAALTRASERLLTPQYAAPEQLLGQAVGVGADVYALGMLLYLLLADELPYRLAGSTAVEQHQLVCEREPPPPSTQAADPSRAARLRGDLDLIVLAALRKEPARRYASVEALAADLRRWQQGLPITARPDTLGYRAGRFVRRNRLAVAGAVLLFLSLAGGLAASLWQAREAGAARALAEQRYRDVRSLASSFITDIDAALLTVPASTQARRLLVERALAYLDGLAADGSDDAGLLIDLGTGYERIAEIYGSTTEANLGDIGAARRHAERSRGLFGEALRLDPESEAALLGTARADLLLASVNEEMGGDSGALLAGVEAVLSRIDANQDPEHLSLERAQVLQTALNQWGSALFGAQRYEEGAAAHRRALDICLQVLSRADNPDPGGWRRSAAVSRLGYASVAWWADMAPETVLAEARQAVEEFEALLAEEPTNARLMRQVAFVNAMLTRIVAYEQDIVEALPYIRRTNNLAVRLVQMDPDNALLRRDAANWQMLASDLFNTDMNWLESARYAENAFEYFDRLMSDEPLNLAHRSRWEHARCQYAFGLLRGHEAGFAEDVYGPGRICGELEPCMQVLDKVIGEQPPLTREVDRWDRLRALYARCEAQPDGNLRLR
jgi:eukaryotic-like serine/threonine-protein kinase